MNDEWMTPSYIIEPVREALGGHIMLDPASSALANEIVQAEHYLTSSYNGLAIPWNADTLFMNPPYSRGKIGLFCNKLLEAINAGSVDHAIALVNSSTETKWWQMLASSANGIFLPSKRICFEREVNGLRVSGSSPRYANTLMYFGNEADRFKKAMLYFDGINLIHRN